MSAFSTARGFPNIVRRRFGSGCAYARVDLNFSLTVLPLCGRCCASVLLCLRLIPSQNIYIVMYIAQNVCFFAKDIFVLKLTNLNNVSLFFLIPELRGGIFFCVNRIASMTLPWYTTCLEFGDSP